jgi:hypothetical protein
MSDKKHKKHRCEYCNENFADTMGKNKNTGLFNYRRYLKKYECKPCQRARLGKSYLTQAYMNEKLDYCENIDGRLGFVCNTDIDVWYKRHGNYYFLQVDHANENHNDNNPWNLQTLCVLCHQYKSRIAIETQYICEEGIKADDIMLHMFTCMYPNDDKKVQQTLKELKENVVRDKKRKNRFKPGGSSEASLACFL